jgi:hypothetical protein
MIKRFLSTIFILSIITSPLYSMEWRTAGQCGLVSAAWSAGIPFVVSASIALLNKGILPLPLKMMGSIVPLVGGAGGFIMGSLGTYILNTTRQKSLEHARNAGILSGSVGALYFMAYGILLQI